MGNLAVTIGKGVSLTKEAARSLYTNAMVKKDPKARDSMRTVLAQIAPDLPDVDLRLLTWAAESRFRALL